MPGTAFANRSISNTLGFVCCTAMCGEAFQTNAQEIYIGPKVALDHAIQLDMTWAREERGESIEDGFDEIVCAVDLAFSKMDDDGYTVSWTYRETTWPEEMAGDRHIVPQAQTLSGLQLMLTYDWHKRLRGLENSGQVRDLYTAYCNTLFSRVNQNAQVDQARDVFRKLFTSDAFLQGVLHQKAFLYMAPWGQRLEPGEPVTEEIEVVHHGTGLPVKASNTYLLEPFEADDPTYRVKWTQALDPQSVEDALEEVQSRFHDDVGADVQVADGGFDVRYDAVYEIDRITGWPIRAEVKKTLRRLKQHRIEFFTFARKNSP